MRFIDLDRNAKFIGKLPPQWVDLEWMRLAIRRELTVLKENIQRIEDDITDVITLYPPLPTLEEIEVIVRPHYKYVEIVFYNPEANADQPWLWLKILGELHKIYPALTAKEVSQFICRKAMSRV